MTPERSDPQEVAKATDSTAETMQPQWFPINAHEAPEAYVVVAPLPAVTPDDVTVELRDGSLHISARLRSSGPREYVLHEWEYGGYEREIDLPQEFAAGLETTLTNGQLVVRVLRGPFSQEISTHPH
jgi:HSP20 family molecular chaperone IbpA